MGFTFNNVKSVLQGRHAQNDKAKENATDLVAPTTGYKAPTEPKQHIRADTMTHVDLKLEKAQNWAVKLKGKPGYHPVKNVLDMGAGKQNSYLLHDGRQVAHEHVEDLDLNHKSKNTAVAGLKKDEPAPRAKKPRLKINRKYLVPCVAGYSKDGTTIYIDRRLPEKLGNIKIDQYLMVHEATEKQLIDGAGFSYSHAHALALGAERKAVQDAGHSWAEYDKPMQQWIKFIEHNTDKTQGCPPDLDPTPLHERQGRRPDVRSITGKEETGGTLEKADVQEVKEDTGKNLWSKHTDGADKKKAEPAKNEPLWSKHNKPKHKAGPGPAKNEPLEKAKTLDIIKNKYLPKQEASFNEKVAQVKAANAQPREKTLDEHVAEVKAKYATGLKRKLAKALKTKLADGLLVPQVSVVGVMDNGKLLMGKRRDNGKYTFPCGHAQKGENPKETAARELFEETGLRPDFLHFVGRQLMTGQDGQRRFVHAFICRAPHGQATPVNDPDREVAKWESVPVKGGQLPSEVEQNLHVPTERNLILKLMAGGT